MPSEGRYTVGFDVGSSAIHSVILDGGGAIVHSPDSRLHFGNPVDTLRDVYEEIIAELGFEAIETTALTGTVGEMVAERTDVPFFHDTITIPAGADFIAPGAGYVFHIGARDSYFFEKEQVQADGGWRTFVPDHSTGSKCGGGSGILITKQCRRFFESEFPVELGESRSENRRLLQDQLDRIFSRAEEEISDSDKEIDVGGRCGVVIQSDMIHLQNSGEQIRNILKGMFERVGKNFKSDVIKTRALDPDREAVATGAVFSSAYLATMFGEQLGLKITVPDNHQKVGAIGAAIKARDVGGKFRSEELSSIAEAEKQKIKTAPPLSAGLSEVTIYDEDEKIDQIDDLSIYRVPDEGHPIDVVLGIDGGSTTTKAILLCAEDLKIVAEICLNTNGRPLPTAQEMLRQIRDHIGKGLNIKGVAYTGSSGAFYHKLFTDHNRTPEKQGADIVKDEITCHALGVKHYNEDVDTIFELGGQDAKFTLFNSDGTVKKAKMNLSCMAGTGQTMHNMVSMIGLDIKSTFHEYALRAERTPIVDETCGIFTEAGIAKLISMGFPKEEIAAAIAFGFMGGYVNKFVGNEKFGRYASAQGGPFNGKSCLASLALHTGIEVHAFPHRQLFGALGAALAVHQEIRRLETEGLPYESRFRGLDVANMEFEKRVELCSAVVAETCEARDCALQVYQVGVDVVYSGGLCPKGNKDTSRRKTPNYVALYRKILERHLDQFTVPLDEAGERERVLIPRSLTFLNEKGTFYAALYRQLGFDVCVSPQSDDTIANLGANFAHSETCFPVKLAHGHAAYLKEHLRKGKDKILLVNAMAVEDAKRKFCPYVASAGFLAKDGLCFDNRDTLLPVVFFENTYFKIDQAVKADLDRVFGKRFSMKKIRAAIQVAQEAEEAFLDEIHTTGEKILTGLKKKGEMVFVGLGRGYTVLDDKASSKVHELFQSYGLHFVPAFFLELPDHDLDEIAPNMYWYQGQNILKGNLMVALDPSLFPVRETNFNCGTDSMILFHEEDIMNKAEMPHLVLQTDGHNSNAQFGTRIMANYEVARTHAPRPMGVENFRAGKPVPEMKNRIIGIPYMGDSSRSAVAAFRALGYESTVMPTHTERSLEFARKFVSTNTCRPFAFQVGDTLAWLNELKDQGVDPNREVAIMEPTARGPCRFGQYAVLLRKFFDRSGFNGVPIVSPDAENDYSDFPISKRSLIELSKLVYKSNFSNELLLSGMLRTRPYEADPGAAEAAYDSLRGELYELIESGASTADCVDLMGRAKDVYASVLNGHTERKPLVIMNGEIFVRCHPSANYESIKLLEKYGLEVMLNSSCHWIEYVNDQYLQLNRDSWKLGTLIVSLIKKRFMSSASAKLYAPMADYLVGREPHDISHVLSAGQKEFFYDKLVGGEAPLSIGETYLFAKGEFEHISGIYHVGPFGCMQETAASSQIQALVQKHRLTAEDMKERIVPFMDGVFGDSEPANFEAEIAAFSEKCHLRKELSNNGR